MICVDGKLCFRSLHLNIIFIIMGWHHIHGKLTSTQQPSSHTFYQTGNDINNLSPSIHCACVTIADNIIVHQTFIKRTSLNLSSLTDGRMRYSSTVTRYIQNPSACIHMCVVFHRPGCAQSSKFQTRHMIMCQSVLFTLYVCLKLQLQAFCHIFIIIVETRLCFGCCLSCVTLVMFNNTVKMFFLLKRDHTVSG